MKTSNSIVLVADDDPSIRRLLEFNLEQLGLSVRLASDGASALAALNEDIVAALIDLDMPKLNGIEILARLGDRSKRPPVIIISALAQVRQAVDAIKKGAFDYVTKPFDFEQLATCVMRAVDVGRTQRQSAQWRSALAEAAAPDVYVGASPVAVELKAKAERLAALDSTVLLTGESGVGKGLLARLIHSRSRRASEPFVTVSCPSLPRELLESELFGHEKGAFTGAHQQRIGRVEAAEGGTLFLDEVGDLPLELQPKLLSFLQERTFTRVGGNRQLDADVRIVAATNVNLRAKVQKREFREDLYFRLNVLPLHLPPLRERMSDVPKLIEQTLRRIGRARLLPEPLQITAAALEVLVRYDWPGNVRELENVMERASAFCSGGTIEVGDIPDEILHFTRPPSPEGGSSAAVPTPLLTLREREQQAVQQTLAACQGNKARAARVLGISEKSIYNMLARYKPVE